MKLDSLKKKCEDLVKSKKGKRKGDDSSSANSSSVIDPVRCLFNSLG